LLLRRDHDDDPRLAESVGSIRARTEQRSSGAMPLPPPAPLPCPPKQIVSPYSYSHHIIIITIIAIRPCAPLHTAVAVRKPPPVTTMSF
jgi:hypothetical protein